MKRWLIFLLILPFVFSYPISVYTGGDVFLPAGKEVDLILPFPEGNDCLPVAVFWVTGGKDYPEINVNGTTFLGQGLHRMVLEGNEVRITAKSNLPALIEGNSLIYCTKDPFVFVEYNPPVPIRVGNFNYIDVMIKNYGYAGTDLNLQLQFHPDLAPFFPVTKSLHIPGRKKGTAYAFSSISIFTISGPFVMKSSAHPRVCISYKDSVMLVRDCDGPVPTEPTLNPRITCVDDRCYNTSNLQLETNDGYIQPGDSVSEGDLTELSEYNLHIKKITFTSKNEAFQPQRNIIWFYLIVVGVVIAGIFSVVFK